MHLIILFLIFTWTVRLGSLANFVDKYTQFLRAISLLFKLMGIKSISCWDIGSELIVNLYY